MSITTMFDCAYTNYGLAQEIRIYGGPVKVTKGFKMNPEAFKRMWKVVEYIDQDGKIRKAKFETEYYNVRQDRMNKNRSYRRSMQKYFGYALSTPWKYFVTFTFDRRLCDRYNYKECYRFLNRWVKWYRKRVDRTWEMLIVMEHHKDQAIHFHALVDCKKPPMTHDDGISNLLCEFALGRSDVKRITETPLKVANYVSKYMVKSRDALNVRRYHRFGDLKQSVTIRTTYDKVEDYVQELLTGGYDVYTKRLDNSVIIKAYTNYDLNFHRLTNTPYYLWQDYEPEYEQLELAL